MVQVTIQLTQLVSLAQIIDMVFKFGPSSSFLTTDLSIILLLYESGKFKKKFSKDLLAG